MRLSRVLYYKTITRNNIRRVDTNIKKLNNVNENKSSRRKVLRRAAEAGTLIACGSLVSTSVTASDEKGYLSLEEAGIENEFNNLISSRKEEEPNRDIIPVQFEYNHLYWRYGAPGNISVSFGVGGLSISTSTQVGHWRLEDSTNP
jgi:hypothetical protein